jgi:hypothetical protein
MNTYSFKVIRNRMYLQMIVRQYPAHSKINALNIVNCHRKQP